ncbi:MAG TPA: NAD(P)-dependent oxidoreductase, partial [Actinomycetes bacterium]|nr:NAD(P)-dependent oxidoreductase [Actinomycetes bacterium]
MRPRLLVLDDVEGRIAGSPAMARLRELAEVTVLDRPLGDGDLDRLAGVRVLLAIRERTRLDTALLDRLPDLELVLQTGGHAYHVDQEAATGRGIVVALSRRAQMASASVPELTFGLMLAVLRRIHPLAARLAAGQWPAAMGGTLAGRTLGILGLGRHGRPVARIAAAFGMLALAWDRDPGREYDDDEPVAERLPLDDLLERSDVVSIHLRLSPDVRGLLDRDRLARMRPGAVLVNTARGAIVDE